ncbi:hypothetical protein [Planomonospora sphaerica]|uniref:hypothetical protein n=1 Tax=Planomonospora sphaerica TaxID=161355 RepID=UPI00083B40BA|nr:hypothetical protein [Planomonospora sphaerica]
MIGVTASTTARCIAGPVKAAASAHIGTSWSGSQIATALLGGLGTGHGRSVSSAAILPSVPAAGNGSSGLVSTTVYLLTAMSLVG